MTDIVKRLRDAGLRNGFAIILKQEVNEAADEIERLRAFIQEVASAEHERHPQWQPLVEEACRIFAEPKP